MTLFGWTGLVYWNARKDRMDKISKLGWMAQINEMVKLTKMGRTHRITVMLGWSEGWLEGMGLDTSDGFE